MAIHNHNQDNNNSRRKFIQQSGVLGAGVMLNDAWAKVVNKEARYRYVIDASTF